MACHGQRLRVLSISFILILIIFISFNEFFSDASSPKQKKELKSVRFVQKGRPPYIASSSPVPYFSHLQTTVEQDSSSSSEEASEKGASHSKSTQPKYRFVHAPVGYEKSTESLLAEIQSLKEMNEKLSEEVKSQAQKIKSLMSENKDLKGQIESETKKANSSKSKLRNLDDDIKKKEKQNSSLLAIITQKDRIISEQKGEIFSLEQKLKEKDLNLENKEKALFEMEKQTSQNIQQHKAKEEELIKINERQESDALKLKEKIDSLSATVDDFFVKQTALENDKKQLEDKLQEMTDERDKAKSALNDCLESLNTKESKTEQENVPKDVQPSSTKKTLYDAVIKQMGAIQKREKWVKAPPLRRPEGTQKRSESTPEIYKVFKSLKEKEEKDFEAFVVENGLQNETKETQKEQYKKFKERNVSPSPKGIQQFSRFRKESFSD
ncbi:uncharacterized protein cubi_00058 [Cryptosporidium ubiquitum]|uniref:Uncharacterized protein n=1 Tax=Cryptosporidium ubiquitum TaxID=857276 RepID=A0A1J4MJU5_9CRYT|nr:uncharacterized protein cubi_00058 [Cryptosporidium ubiquitum]OII74505.1 hypothetical protein cubi_00058 [Cryptosporidium ubiquitum]